MKTLNVFQFLVIVFFGALTFTSCEDQDTTTDLPELTSEEISMLSYMREEEKLARDVYTHLSSLYSINMFANISTSEQKHIDFVLDLMNTYKVSDVGSSVPGEFVDADLQTLYDALIEQGSQSLIEALKVGATIEDVDIFDLKAYKSRTENTDLISLFDLLECGSRNHMRAFTGRLLESDITYEPQYISQEVYEDVINGAHESCS